MRTSARTPRAPREIPMTTDPADFDTWLTGNPPPTLQELLDQYGTWGLIPPAAWDQWDTAYTAWESNRRDRLLGSHTWAMTEAKRKRK